MLHRSTRPAGCRSHKRAGRRAVVTRAALSNKYDYIIVGGGTSGCILANRLTEDEGKRVLVLEAGGKGGALETRIPAGLSKLFQHPRLDWNLFSTQQQHLDTRSVYLARGKTLGGSSSTNATLYIRGTAEDFDAWDLDGWRAKDVLPGFVAAECNGSFPAGPYHGTSGAMHVESPRYDNPLHAEFFAAAASAGLPANPDFNDWSRPQVGYGEFQVFHKNGQRADAFGQYLAPIMNRPNLEVMTDTTTRRVAFEQSASGTRAVGVEFITGGRGGQAQTAELAPGGQVVMCAGTVHTPQILMLSGVGPAAHLAEHGIPLVAEAAGLGADLQDHPGSLLACKAKPEHEQVAVTSEIYDQNGRLRWDAIAKLLFLRRGPLVTTGCDHGAFVATSGSGPADLQIRFVPGYALDPDAIKSYVIFDDMAAQGKPWPGGITMQLLACRPHSRGRVGLASTDPFDSPAVDLGYFTDAGGKDLRTLVEGVKFARKISQQLSLAKYLAEEGWPGAGVQSDDDIEAFLRRSTCSGNALVGTARMGAAPTDGSVVSCNDFGLWGVQGLKVVDASLMPRIPGAQTAPATVLIAERAAKALRGGAGAQVPASAKAAAMA